MMASGDSADGTRRNDATGDGGETGAASGGDERGRSARARETHRSAPQTDPSATAARGRGCVVGGVVLLAGAFALAAAEQSPGRVFFYHMAWAGTLAAMAGGLARRTGRWPLDRRGAVSLFFWSAPAWYLYELLNFRIENWYYVLIAPEAPVRWVGTLLAFGTVLPALHLAYRWFRELDFAEAWTRPRFRVRSPHLAATGGLGVLFVALAMWRPRAFYPLVWGAVTLLLEPWNYRRDPSTSLLGDLARGRYARMVRLLLGGFVIGVLWELYNSMAAARWIYTVPGLEDVKLFEMPVPGFLGFPLLALDGYVMYRALESLGVAWPAWGDGDAEGATAESRDRGGFRPGRAAVAAVGALAFCTAVQLGIDRWTVSSVYPAVRDLPGVTSDEAARLRDAGVDDPEALAAADSASVARRAGLDAAEAGAAVRAARLAMLRGIGAANAAALWRSEVRSVCALAAADEDRVVAALRAQGGGPGAVDPARVRVWLRAARERCDDSSRTRRGR